MLLSGILLTTTSCFDDKDKDNDTTDYTEWKERNEEYINKQALRTNEDGSPFYEKIVPSWATGTFVLIKWHNNRAITADNLSPLDNSTINMKYDLMDIEGNVIDSSYALKNKGDSIYQTRPSQMIVGVRAALPVMHIGDSVTLVLPYSAGYGNISNGKIKPFSTLTFHIKLVAIPGYEILPK